MKIRNLLSAGLIAAALSSYASAADTKLADIPEPPPAVQKPVVESIEDLKEISRQTKLVTDRVMPTVVGIFDNQKSSAGSGVIVSKDGIVLTAGHVSGDPGRPIEIRLPDGRKLKAKTLGRYSKIDSGMIKITDPGEYPFAKMGKMSDVKRGDWCIAMGHPGGYKEGRPPVVRVGKIGSISPGADPTFIRTDCTLVGGDSGGPLFDMQGRVIGINSRINQDITTNVHVPINTFRDTWARLLKGADIGNVWFGVSQADEGKECVLGDITAGSPAEKGGLKAGDVVNKFDSQLVKDYPEMKKLLNEKDPGDEVEIELKRGDQNLTLKVKLGKQSDRPKGR